MKKGLKLLWITERFPPLAGGMAVSAERQVAGLRKEGFKVDVLAFFSQEGPVSVKRLQKDNGLDIYIRHQDEPGNAAQRAWRELLHQSADGQYDLVLGFGAGFPGYVAVTFAAWLNIPSMISVRGNDFDRDWFENKKNTYVTESLGRADAVAVVSKEKKDKIAALFPGKYIFPAPNGVDAGYYELLPSEQEESRALRYELGADGRRIFGVFGELKYKKRIPMWLSAIRSAGLTERISLLVAGRMDAETDAIISDSMLAPLSRHFSFREQDRLPPVYSACDFILLPSLFEGFPNVLLEAMVSGCIPVVSAAGAMNDIIEDGKNGFIFEPENRKDIVRAAGAALELSDKALDAMKERVRKEVRERFTPENEIRVLANEIFRLAGVR